MTPDILLDCASGLHTENITSQPWWQIFIVLATSFLTTFLTHVFTDLSQRTSQLSYAKANLSKYAYHLDQVTTSYLESLLNGYYYMLAAQHMDGNLKDTQFQLMTHEGSQSAELVLEISKTNSTLIQEFSIIRQTVGRRKTTRLEKLLDAIIYFESYNIPRPALDMTELQANQYVQENIDFIKKNSERLKGKILKLIRELDCVNLQIHFFTKGEKK